MAVHQNLRHIYSYLVNPGKGSEEELAIAATAVPLSGKMFNMLESIYDDAPTECKIPIAFDMNGNGEQKNEVRDEIIDILLGPSEGKGLILAKRLQKVTTNKSGLGLLFLSIGTNGNEEPKIVISRFPADEGVVAETPKGKALEVSFVEKVFMKNAHAYKAALYQGASYDSHFWEGRAVDRQINSSASLANYWIRDFLHSDFKITPESGTKMLAIAFKEVAAMPDAKVREEVVAAIQLARNLNGQAITMREMTNRFGLSKPTRDALISKLPNPEIADVTFRFSQEEFAKHVSYVSKELDNGAILAAPSAIGFDEIFTTRKNGPDGQCEFTTKGMVVNQRVRNRKA
jgi:hypothetical protein